MSTSSQENGEASWFDGDEVASLRAENARLTALLYVHGEHQCGYRAMRYRIKGRQ